MTKVLVLAVDRDDDFGVKGNVETPVIGIKKATDAVISLGVVDPEDSDINALLAAIQIYNDLIENGKEAEIALICGNMSVGHRSDSSIIEEFDRVIDDVKPDSAILVGNGSEDEFIYPIIASRIRIDSVKKVFVKQTPNIEGSLYILERMLSEPQKRKRFLVPLGLIIFIASVVWIADIFLRYNFSQNLAELSALTVPIIVLLISITIMMHGYNSIDKLLLLAEEWKNQIHNSKSSMIFSILSIAMVIIGIIIGYYSIKNILCNSIIYVTLVFVSNVVWLFAFAFFFNDIGNTLDEYIEKRRVTHSFMTGSITLFGTVFIIQGIIDFVKNYIGYGSVNGSVAFIEIILGILLALSASVIHVPHTMYTHSEGIKNEK